MPSTTYENVTDTLRMAAQPLTGSREDYDLLLDRIGDAHFVLLGEASHGTHEFYHERARITQRLIEEKGFTAVAVEGDWPDAYRVNRYIRGTSDDSVAVEALADFRRFPTWMWRNTDVVEFIEWLRGYNEGVPADSSKAGFYGVDLYSLHASMEEVLRYLAQVDPDAARQARARYACFDHFGKDTQVYGFLTGTGIAKSCEDEVIKQLVDLRRRIAAGERRDGGPAEEEAFYAEQNAYVVLHAEQYYRSMFLAQVSSWNLRDRHMSETLEALAKHLRRQRREAKIAVWAHNSHVGDARVTEMSRRGEWNLGQLAREKYSDDTVLGPSLRLPTGTAPPRGSGFVRRSPTAMRRCSMAWRLTASCSSGAERSRRPKVCVIRASSGRSESSTGPKRNVSATTSLRSFQNNSTR
jgi:erythromycin esterase-like protein